MYLLVHIIIALNPLGWLIMTQVAINLLLNLVMYYMLIIVKNLLLLLKLILTELHCLMLRSLLIPLKHLHVIAGVWEVSTMESTHLIVSTRLICNDSFFDWFNFIEFFSKRDRLLASGINLPVPFIRQTLPETLV